GAEVAFALARASHSPVTALYVSSAAGPGSRMRRIRGMRQQDEAVLREIVLLGRRYDIEVRTAIRANLVPEDAILRQARLAGPNLACDALDRRHLVLARSS